MLGPSEGSEPGLDEGARQRIRPTRGGASHVGVIPLPVVEGYGHRHDPVPSFPEYASDGVSVARRRPLAQIWIAEHPAVLRRAVPGNYELVALDVDDESGGSGPIEIGVSKRVIAEPIAGRDPALQDVAICGHLFDSAAIHKAHHAGNAMLAQHRDEAVDHVNARETRR